MPCVCANVIIGNTDRQIQHNNNSNNKQTKGLDYNNNNNKKHSYTLYLESSEYLIDEELDVVVCESLLPHNVVQVRPHEMGDQIQLLEIIHRWCWSEHIQQTHHLKRDDIM